MHLICPFGLSILMEEGLMVCLGLVASRSAGEQLQSHILPHKRDSAHREGAGAEGVHLARDGTIIPAAKLLTRF